MEMHKEKKLVGRQVNADFFKGYIGVLEIEEALLIKDILEGQFNLAVNTSNKLKDGLLSNIEVFIDFTMKCKELLEK